MKKLHKLFLLISGIISLGLIFCLKSYGQSSSDGHQINRGIFSQGLAQNTSENEYNIILEEALDSVEKIDSKDSQILERNSLSGNQDHGPMPSLAQNHKEVMLDALEVKEMPLTEVLERIELKTGVTMITEEEITGKVTIFLKDVELRDALRIILEMNGFAFYELPSGEIPDSLKREGAQQRKVFRILSAQNYLLRFGHPFADQVQTRLIPLQNSSASEMSQIVNKIKSPSGKVIPSERNNTLIVIDSPAVLESIISLVKELDVPLQSQQFQIKNVTAKKVAEDIRRVLTEDLGQVTYNEDSNNLQVTDTPFKIKKIAELITRLDQESTKVLFEVKVIQIALNDEHIDGVDWEAIVSDYDSMPFLGFRQAQEEDQKSILSFGTVSEEDYHVLLEALDTVGSIHPVLDSTLHQDGQEKVILAIRSHEASLGIQDPKQPLSERISAVKMHLFPLLTSDDMLDVTLEPEFLPDFVSERLEKNKDAREIHVEVDNGATIVVGGLFKDVTVDATWKIPLLGDLPLLGFVFRSQAQRKQKTEIIVFLTPKLVTGE